ncbi:MAG TPA: ABC transporter permease [Candidatus Gracilibacteria bacterium]|nr:ABC transporter permease [Candidatus Gracilibacteria bacterium]
MYQFKALFKKELRIYFNSPIAYIFAISFLVFSTWLFFRFFFLQGQVEMRSFFGILPWLFLFFLPALSMRLWSEEYRQGTIEVLFTSGISEWKAVAAKYLASVTLLLSLLLLTALLPISISFLGNLDWGVVLLSYLGAFLLGAAYLSIGLWASALTSNQIVAFILGILSIFGVYIVGHSMVTFSLPAKLASIFQMISLSSHYESISRGVLDTRDLIYFVSIILLFGGLNVYLLIKKR